MTICPKLLAFQQQLSTMQTYKERTGSNGKHQRSLSFCNYDEFRRRDLASTTGETEFRQRRPLIGGEPSTSDEANSNVISELSPMNDVNESINYGNQINSQSGSSVDTEKNAVCSELNSLLLDQENKSVVSAGPMVKGHRRSFSLRQRFEVGYEFIVSEFEHARVVAEKTVFHASETVWKVCHFNHLPNWMQDNEYLHWGHRPPLPSLWACAKSIFRIHTETGNIWTHGIGALIFLGLLIYEFATISANKTATDRLMLAIYFSGIILCLLFSTLFHTFSCYASPRVIKIFSKLDYCGISLQIIGSMIPALYYGFYENMSMFKIYISFGVVLCILSIIVSMWDKFGEPQYRSLRAIVFLTFGLSNVIPGVHWYIILDSHLIAAFSLFIAQGLLYVIGALLYANRIPERLLPGKCDYVFQSHQIFHVLVVLAALVHLNGINSMANYHMEVKMHAAAASSTTAAPIVVN